VDGQPVVWEACQTFSGSWGYHRDEASWKSLDMLILMLIDSVAKGGNLLLNVGPKPDGSLPWEPRAGLKATGRWMRAYGESIYGSSASPYSSAPAWGRCTAKSGLLYAHIFDWPRERILRLPAIRNMIGAVYPMGRPGAPLSFRRAGEGIEIDLPAYAPDPWDSVIVLELDGVPEAVPAS
jgi:alpha-L-fucosidase